MLVAIPVLSWTMETDGEIAPAPLKEMQDLQTMVCSRKNMPLKHIIPAQPHARERTRKFRNLFVKWWVVIEPPTRGLL
jgi:hypothetical protein